MASENKCESCKCHVPITLRDFFWQDPFFSTNWDDFDKLHEKMVQETKDLWNRFDRQLKSLEDKDEATKEVSENAKEADDSGSWFFPRSLMRLPSLFSGEMTKDLLLKEEQTINVRDDDKVFEVSLDTRNYRPDEIKVDVVDKVLNIEGKHEEKSEDGNKFTSRQFVRKYTLPAECSADQVVSNLSADGVLLVTAPKLALKDAERAVPIQMENK
jgi:HSP20 family molecular chaperone IbpA